MIWNAKKVMWRLYMEIQLMNSGNRWKQNWWKITSVLNARWHNDVTTWKRSPVKSGRNVCYYYVFLVYWIFIDLSYIVFASSLMAQWIDVIISSW